jgi:hypothetical protein
VKAFVDPGDEEALIVATTTALRELLDRDLAIVGDVVKHEGGYEIRSWGLPPADAAGRIEREWRALGRPVDSSEIAWVQPTPAGYALGKRLLDEEDPGGGD